MKTLYCLFFIMLTNLSIAQDTTALGQDTYFADGIYLSHEQVVANQPDYTWDVIDTEAFVDVEDGFVTFNTIQVFEDSRVRTIPMTEIWGVSLEGKFYINLEQTNREVQLVEVGKEPVRFVRLQAIGKLCYFYYLGYVKEQVPISVYHPRTGTKLQTSYVENWKSVVVKKILKFETGQLYAYNLRNFKELIQDDRSLWATINDLPENEARQKMFRSLFIYNDRNPVYFKSFQ